MHDVTVTSYALIFICFCRIATNVSIDKHGICFVAAFSWKRCVLRSCLMLLILGIAEAIPKFGPILSLIGGSTTTCLTFIFPCLFYLKIVKGHVPLHIRVLMYEIILVAVCGGVAASYSAIKSIIQVFTWWCKYHGSQKVPRKYLSTTVAHGKPEKL